MKVNARSFKGQRKPSDATLRRNYQSLCEAYSDATGFFVGVAGGQDRKAAFHAQRKLMQRNGVAPAATYVVAQSHDGDQALKWTKKLAQTIKSDDVSRLRNKLNRLSTDYEKTAAQGPEYFVYIAVESPGAAAEDNNDQEVEVQVEA